MKKILFLIVILSLLPLIAENNDFLARRRSSSRRGKRIRGTMRRKKRAYNNVFPKDATHFLPEVAKSHKHVRSPVNCYRTSFPCIDIYITDKVRVKAQRHDLDPPPPGRGPNPRHQLLHYHVQIRRDTKKGWDVGNNYDQVLPPGQKPGQATGFIPGESFPKELVDALRARWR